MARKTGNYMVKIVRVNHDGTRDYLNMLEMDKYESAKRSAANYARGANVWATIYDVFNGGQAVAQYYQGHKVAQAVKD